MPGGRPRTVSLDPENMIALGEEMLQWVLLNNPIHLCEWYSFQKKFTKSQWRAMIICPEFLTYYEEALQLVGMNYIKKDTQVEPSLKQRWQRVYFGDLRSQEDADLDAAMERSKKVEGVKNDKYILIANAALTAGSNVSTETISGEISSST